MIALDATSRRLAAVALLLPTAALAQATLPAPAAPRALARTLPAARAERAPTIDGRLDDAAWRAATPAGAFVQHRPRPGAAATMETEVRVLYDDAAVYVAVRARDPRPDSIVARLARRDQDVYSDWFGVLLDSYADRRTAFGFAVNPLGVKRDYAITEDAREDAGWDAVWDVATATDADGWTAEFRIPLSQLRFTAGAGERPWGVNFARLVARRDELSYWSPVAPEAVGLVSQFGELAGLRDLRPPRRLELQPYTVARATRAPGDAADPFHRRTELGGSMGADVKYGVTSNLTLTATLNPDFGQVEADPSQVNLTAFEAWYAERRPFFAEGAEMFSVGFPQLFYSRRIGAAPRGRVGGPAAFVDVPERTRILGAAKLTGKTARGWSVGLLTAVTARESAAWIDTAGADTRGRQLVEPLSSFAIGRVVRDFRRGASSVGAVVTAVHRESAPELAGITRSQAYVGGLNARHRFAGGGYEADAVALASRVAGPTAGIGALQRASYRAFQRPDAAHVAFDSTRTSLDGILARVGVRKASGNWRWSLGALAITPEFEANDMGFAPMADEIRQSAVLSYQQFAPTRLFRSLLFEAAQSSEWTFGRERVETSASAGALVQLHSFWTARARVARSASALDPAVLRGGPALRAPASSDLSIGVVSDRRRGVQLDLSAGWEREDATGGRLIELQPSVVVRASDRAEVAVGPSLAWNRNPAQYVGTYTAGGQPQYLVGRIDQTTSSMTVRVDYTFRPTLSLQLYAEPFVSAGRFADFRAVRSPRAGAATARFRTLGADAVTRTDVGGRAGYAIDFDGDRTVDARLADPSFNVRQFNSNAVLRWEYRPGSTLFVVWGQTRAQAVADGRYDLRRDAAALMGAPATNVLAIKASYWLGL